jgi:hypothetical protein
LFDFVYKSNDYSKWYFEDFVNSSEAEIVPVMDQTLQVWQKVGIDNINFAATIPADKYKWLLTYHGDVDGYTCVFYLSWPSIPRRNF